MSLYPTPVRLKLLRDVAAGEVHRYGDGVDYAHGWLKVTAAMGLMEKAGWVYLDAWGSGHKHPWLLTDAGRAVLDKAAEAAVWREVQ